MRIISGSLGGRKIEAPAGSRVRPTSDRVRESLFSILGPPLPDTRVLDAFAGAGSLGLEALSRGASEVVFIDKARASVQCVRRNLAALAVAERAQVYCADSIALIKRWTEQHARGKSVHKRFRWLFLDPPYRTRAVDHMLTQLGAGQLLTADATVIVEHDRRNPPAQRWGALVQVDRRRYGDTEVSLFQPRARPPEEDPPTQE